MTSVIVWSKFGIDQMRPDEVRASRRGRFLEQFPRTFGAQLCIAQACTSSFAIVRTTAL
jgi:hypothetical protein